jgi:hypothetical protein
VHAMNPYGGSEGNSSSVDGGAWSTSCPGRFTPGEGAPGPRYTLNKRLVGPKHRRNLTNTIWRVGGGGGAFSAGVLGTLICEGVKVEKGGRFV